MALELRGVSLLGCARQAVTWVLIIVVLAGGVCPALYGAVLPHEHLFVGGLPPADWENHPHPNPIIELLPGGTGARAAVAEAIPSPSMSRALAAGHVVSLYAGLTSLVLTIVVVDGILPAWVTLPRPNPGPELRVDPPILHPLTIWPPPAPPPRAD
jgi:hypothetical protein